MESAAGSAGPGEGQVRTSEHGLVAFYYALTGFACVIYYRRELRNNLRNAGTRDRGAVIGVGMLLLGAVGLFACRVASAPAAAGGAD